MERITKRHLEARAAMIAKRVNAPAHYSVDGKIVVGHIYLQKEFKGWSLLMVSNDMGGVDELIRATTSREMWAALVAYYNGLMHTSVHNA